MRQQANYQEWDEDDVAIGSDGEVSNRDVEWERDFNHWDRRGIADPLLALARPLLEGTPKQRAQAERLLGREENTFEMSDNARRNMCKLLLDHGLLGQAESVQKDVAEELLRGWEETDPINGGSTGPTGFRYDTAASSQED